MSAFEKLSAMGADVVGGDLILKHKVLGHFRNGDLHLTEDGQKMLEVDDVVAKEDAKPTAKPAARKRAAKTTAPAVETAEADGDAELDVDVG